ncbi:MAG: hypothetical protein F6J97_24390 [Leptolyngbya sp. SIO4C1]|nr:hypothetical protein [Leptolyngbya sp. SIO4C1]
MPILAKFLRLLEFVEAAQDVFAFLVHPMGIASIAGTGLYFVLQLLDTETATAATLSSTAALTLYCVLESPKR